MKVLVTGAKGFIGKNLIASLKHSEYVSKILECDVETTEAELEKFCQEADFIFHLAGVNRTDNISDFAETNIGFTEKLLFLLKRKHNKAPVVMASSVQAENKTPYGISKRAAEEVLTAYGNSENIPVYIYRLPNVFGKWCRPNYNSVIATFSHNISRNLPIYITDSQQVMCFAYIDDVIHAFLEHLHGEQKMQCDISPVYHVSLQEIASLLFSFKKSRKNFYVPNLKNAFAKKLYATYLSYLPVENFSYPLLTHTDNRGAFSEVFKSTCFGQVSVNIIKSGQVKGNHWHKTKTEKFLAVSGKGKISFRKIGTEEVITYNLDASKQEIIDIPPGYTHAVKNTGTSDFVTVIWASEGYDPVFPDTYYEEV